MWVFFSKILLCIYTLNMTVGETLESKDEKSGVVVVLNDVGSHAPAVCV